MSPSPVPHLHHPRPQPAPLPQKAKSRRGHVRQVIDLTSSPSPPPVPAAPPLVVPPHLPPHMAIHPHMQQPMLHQTNLPSDVDPRTPVCIGQLATTLLILYPHDYVTVRPNDPSQPLRSFDDFAPVILKYDPAGRERSANGDETINAIPPSPIRVDDSEDPFANTCGVVVQKVANVIGPMLGKGLIKVEAHVKRNNQPVSINAFYIKCEIEGHLPFPVFRCHFCLYIFYSSHPRAISLSFHNTCTAHS